MITIQLLNKNLERKEKLKIYNKRHIESSKRVEYERQYRSEEKNKKKKKEYDKKYHLKNQEKNKEKNKKYNLENPKYQKEWYLKNQEKIKKQHKKWKLKNPNYDKEYRLKNKIRLKKNQDKYELTEKRIKSKIKWIKENRPRYRILQSRTVRRLRTTLFDLLGRECVKCGFNDIRALQFDHINGGGTKQRKKLKSQTSVYRFYVKNLKLAKKQLQVLCANCNFIKDMKRREVEKSL